MESGQIKATWGPRRLVKEAVRWGMAAWLGITFGIVWSVQIIAGVYWLGEREIVLLGSHAAAFTVWAFWVLATPVVFYYASNWVFGFMKAWVRR